MAGHRVAEAQVKDPRSPGSPLGSPLRTVLHFPLRSFDRQAAHSCRRGSVQNAVGLCWMVGLHAGGWASTLTSAGALQRAVAAGQWPAGWRAAMSAFR